MQSDISIWKASDASFRNDSIFHPPVHHVSHLLICAPAPMTGFLYPHSTTFLFIFEFFCTTCTFHNTTDKKETTDECSPPVVSSLMHYPSSCFCFSYFSSHKCNTESMESMPKSMPPDLQGKHRKSSSFLPPKYDQRSCRQFKHTTKHRNKTVAHSLQRISIDKNTS